MIKLKFYINETGENLVTELITEESEDYQLLAFAQKGLSYSLQLNYTDLITINPDVVDMSSSIIFYRDEYEEEHISIELDLSDSLKVVGGVNSPSALAAKAVFEMLKTALNKK